MQSSTISDDKNLSVELIDFGARIRRITYNNTDVALTYKNLSDYLSDPYYLGASVGPIANRIAGGKLVIAGKHYQMPLNEANNSLHSSDLGFDKETWRLTRETKTKVEYEIVFDMHGLGLAGQLTTTVDKPCLFKFGW